MTNPLLLGLKLALEIKKASPGVALKDFVATMESAEYKTKVKELKSKVESFASKFSLPVHHDFK